MKLQKIKELSKLVDRFLDFAEDKKKEEKKRNTSIFLIYY